VTAAGVRRQCLASAPRGFADLLAIELRSFGADDVRERGTAVSFTGDLGVAYRACLESRVASRIYVELARLDASDEAAVYAALLALPWEQHIDPAHSIACEWSGRHPAISNTHFGTLRLKDAICDALRARVGARPDVSTERPGVRVHAHAQGTLITVSIDLAGEGLHRRGYRTEAGEAPLRENVAAGILLRAGWPALAREGAELLDPLCGAGTLVIEAALIAADIAPNLWRDYFGLQRWKQHDAALWERLVESARQRADTGLAQWQARSVAAGAPLLRGQDINASTLSHARANAKRAGVADLVHFESRPLRDAAPTRPGTGLLCANPPYGVRLGEVDAARAVHRELGAVLRERFGGWNAAVLTSPELGLELGLRAERVHVVWNGAIECRLLRLRIDAAAVRDLRPSRERRADPALAATPGAVMFANRIAKNLRRLSSWAKREQVSCWRIYDADMPEYSFAIDQYTAADGEPRWLHVQEYAAPRDIPEQDARRRRSEALAALPAATGVPADNIHLRLRRRTQRGEQYEKLDARSHRHVVSEAGLRFEVNFTDYLDTGLFLDHRITRSRLREESPNQRFLNLFGYTGTATVYAAAGGARSSATVDLSRTYLDWAERNLQLNGLAGPLHVQVQADAREWLVQAGHDRAQFDLIFLDPPTFSNSKRMQGVLDVQRDHVELVDACMQLLSPAGLLLFSTNLQKFRLDASLAARYALHDISRATLPPDFARNARIHQCFELRHA